MKIFNWKKEEPHIYVCLILTNGNSMKLRVTEQQAKEIEKASTYGPGAVASLEFSYTDGKKYLIAWDKICAVEIIR